MATMEELEAKISEMQSGTNTLYLLICGLFVLFMQAGFAFLEAGSVRAKNTTNIILKNVVDVWMAALTYWAVGYSFAYGEPGNGFIGHNYFFGSNLQQNFDGVNTTYGDVGTADHYYVSWFFQFVFTATASTIVSGAMAERTEFKAYLGYCFFLTAFVYPVVSHWGWSSSGWLANGPNGLVFKDFAGSAIVHITGGTAAFCGAVLLGPRIGRFDENGRPNDIPGHTVPITALGAFILFVGFLAFNGGSLLTITGPGDGAKVALVFMNTIIGGSSSAIIALLAYKLWNRVRGKENFWSLLITINAGLAGMVAMCAGCNDIYPWAACVIGSVAGMAFLSWHHLMLKMQVDDPLDAVAVHFGGGMTGIILAPIFAINGQEHEGVAVGGIIYGAHWKAFQGFGWNLLGALVITFWTAVFSLILFGIMRLIGILRVDRDIEIQGLDVAKHNEPAYPVISYEGFLPGSEILKHEEEIDLKKTEKKLRSELKRIQSEKYKITKQAHQSVSDRSDVEQGVRNNGYTTEGV
ncbi:putative ammonium transporter 1 isoform X1 [Styela clava]